MKTLAFLFFNLAYENYPIHRDLFINMTIFFFWQNEHDNILYRCQPVKAKTWKKLCHLLSKIPFQVYIYIYIQQERRKGRREGEGEGEEALALF